MKAIGRICVLLLGFAALGAQATFHLWRMTELYSDASGNIQYVELMDCCSGENLLAGHTLTSTPAGGTMRSFTFPSNLPSSNTAGKRFLVGTQGFANLGVITPDYVVPNGFFGVNGGSVNFADVDIWNHPALPTTNALSLYREPLNSQAANSPTNFAGQSAVLQAGGGATLNYQGLWWRTGGNEGGWGINIVQQGDILFVSWFTYDTDGAGLWLYVPRADKTGNGVYSGALKTTTGPPFNGDPFNSGAVQETTVGTATFTFTDASNGTFAYTVNGTSQSKPIQRFNFASPVPTCSTTSSGITNFTDLWWKNGEGGWGVNMAHQGDIIFLSWFTYGTDGRRMWLYGSRVEKTGTGVYSGPLKRNRGPVFSSTPFDPMQVTEQTVGTVTLTFQNSSNATFAYTVDGIAQSKAITRFLFSSPLTVCTTPDTGGADPDPYYPGG